jgi:hypothetical protein
MRKVIVFLLGLGLLALPVLAQDTPATPVPGSTLQATEIPQTGTAFIRAAHLIADAGVVDVYVNGQLAFADVNPNAVSDWLQIPSGTVSIAFVPAGASFSDVFLGPFDVTLNGNSRTTIAASGSVDAGTVSPLIINESALANTQTSNVTQPGNTRINILDALSETPPVNIELFLVRPNRIGLPLSQLNLAARPGATFTIQPDTTQGDVTSLSVPPGVYNIRMVDAGTEDSLLSFSNVALNANTSYLFAVTDTMDGPWLVIQPSGLSRAMQSSVSGQANSGSQGTGN